MRCGNSTGSETWLPGSGVVVGVSCTKCLALGPDCGWCAQEVCLFPFFSLWILCLFLKVTLLAWFHWPNILCLEDASGKKKDIVEHQENVLWFYAWKQNVWLTISITFFIRKIMVILKWSANHFMFSICSIERIGKHR